MKNITNISIDGASLRPIYAQILRGDMPQLQADAFDSGKGFWKWAWREGVGACVWHALQKQDICVDPEIRTECIEQPLRSQIAHTLMLRAVATEVLRLFSGAGISVVMLRGQAVADVLYSPATMRPQVDIDLLIREGDIQQVADLLAKAGFACLPHHSLLFRRGEVLLDMHTEPLGIERIASWALLTPLRAGDFFRHAHRGPLLGVDALLTDDALQLPYLSFHAMKHSFERLLWLWDIALLARKIGEAGTWAELQTGIASYGLQRPCFYALSYVDAHLAAPVPASLLDTLRPDMDWRERQMFRRFMQHETVPFLAERVFARMQPDFMHRMAFWRETIWPRAEIRAQIDDDTSPRGFTGKRLIQIGKAALMLIGEMGALFRR